MAIGGPALLLYDLTLNTGATRRIAHNYVVRDGRVQTETILRDAYGARTIPAPTVSFVASSMRMIAPVERESA